MADDLADARAHALLEDVVAHRLVVGAQRRAVALCPVAQVARAGLHRLLHPVAGVRGLVADQRPTAAPAVRIEEVHESRADPGAEEHCCGTIHRECLLGASLFLPCGRSAPAFVTSEIARGLSIGASPAARS